MLPKVPYPSLSPFVSCKVDSGTLLMLWGPAQEPLNHEVCDTVKMIVLIIIIIIILLFSLRILFFSYSWLRTYYVVREELILLAILLSQTP